MEKKLTDDILEIEESINPVKSKKITKVEINGLEYKVLEEDVDAVLVEIPSENNKGNKILAKQWYLKSAVKVV